MTAPARTDSPADIRARLAVRPDSQATQIETARAIAEVEGAIIVAQRVPRDMERAVRAMRESCGQLAMAERAFFSYPRAGEAVTGETIWLAKELARVWGNVQYGVAELSRDDTAGMSEMEAFAWDVETNTRSRTMFLVPHRRDTKHGERAIVAMRDIYENNANMGNRRLRAMIFSILPAWFTEEAKELCNNTLTGGGPSGKPLSRRIADAVTLYSELGVSRAQLEEHRGKPVASWTERDLAQVGILYRTLQRGEMTVEEVFEAERTSGRDLVERGQRARDAKETKPARRRGRADGDAAPAGRDGSPYADQSTLDAIGTALDAIPVEPSIRLGVVRALAPRWTISEGAGAPDGITTAEAERVLAGLLDVTSRADLDTPAIVLLLEAVARAEERGGVPDDDRIAAPPASRSGESP